MSLYLLVVLICNLLTINDILVAFFFFCPCYIFFGGTFIKMFCLFLHWVIFLIIEFGESFIQFEYPLLNMYFPMFSPTLWLIMLFR